MLSRKAVTFLVALVAALAVLGTVVWLRQMNGSVQDLLVEMRQEKVARAAQVLDDRFSAEAIALDRTALLLAEDSRIKTGMATSTLDTATLADMLGDVRDRSHFDWLALANADGRVLAVSGLPALKAYQGVDLGSTPLIQKAGDAEAAVARTLWFSDAKGVAIACTGVWRGNHALGFVFLGKAIEPNELAHTADAVQAALGLATNKGDLVTSSAVAMEPLKYALELETDAPALTQVASASYVLVRRPSKAWNNGIVVAAVPSDEQEPRHLRHLGMPLVFVVVLAATLVTHLIGSRPHETKR
jgi:hypothetical protein